VSTVIEKDSVLEGPLWPEPVRVLSVEHFGTLLQVDAVGTRTRQFYPGIIVTAAQADGLKVLSSAKGMDFSGDPEAFHLAIEALRIRLAYEYDPHFAVNASTIVPLPHQLDAVYRYMLKSPLVRFLLADDPGAGKTIMAGLLLKELRFRGLADRILIVVPPLVSRQWQEELAEKFSEAFTIIDNGVLRANVGRNPWTENDRCITSVYWAARDNVLETLKEADWDLVIADEAHKMAAYRQGTRSQKTRKTRLYRLGEELSVRTKHLLLLTATPHKGDPENFRLLLELLDKDLFADRHILEEAMSRQDNPIILRRLKEEMCRFDGSPLFPQRTVKTVAFDLQFCNQMVNYDIPWNPNRLEQRMGRIHRIGQQNEVFIFNLVATDTREGAVLAALLRKMEEMRQGLGSDRVFDLIGDLLEDHEISLADLIIDCITNRRRLADAVAGIEQAVSPEHQAALTAAREEGLARRFVNLPELRFDAARSASQALLPTHLEAFFTRSLERNRGRWERRADGKIRCERVPVNLRREQEIAFRRRHGTVERAYLSLTFDKTTVGEDGRTDLLGPGHPLFESVLQAAESGCIDALARGAVFRDLDAKAPERLWFFRGSVGDGTGRVLSQRLFAVREIGLAGDRTAGGPPASNPAFIAAHPIHLHDLRPGPDGASAPPLTDFDQRRHAATRFCLEHLVPGFVDTVASGRLKDLGLKERWLERSFRGVISRHADRLLDLDAKAGAGQDMALAIGREQRLMEDAKRRRQERLTEVRLEQQLVPRAPEFLGVVAVLPAAARVGEAKADDALLGRVREVEAAQGRTLADRRDDGLGFDAIAGDADGQAVRFILARRLDADGRLWLKASEWAQVRHLGAPVLIYAAHDGEILALSAEDAARGAEIDDTNRRVSIRLPGGPTP